MDTSTLLSRMWKTICEVLDAVAGHKATFEQTAAACKALCSPSPPTSVFQVSQSISEKT